MGAFCLDKITEYVYSINKNKCSHMIFSINLIFTFCLKSRILEKRGGKNMPTIKDIKFQYAILLQENEQGQEVTFDFEA